MAYSQTDVDALKRAIASQELSVEYDGKRITYRSMAELKAALAMVEREVNAATRPRVALARFRRS